MKWGIDLNRLFLTIGAFLLVLLTGVAFASPINAQPTLDDVKQERKEIKSKLSDAEAKIADVLFELEEQNEELERLKDALAKNKKVLDETNEDINAFEAEIDELQVEIDRLNVEIEKRNEVLKSRMSSYQANGGNMNILEVFLGASDFNEFISRVSAVTRVTQADADLLEQQERDQALVALNQSNIEEKLEEKEELLVELKGTEELIKAQTPEIEKKVKKLSDKEAELKAKKANIQSEDNTLAQLEKNIRNGMSTFNPNVAQAASNGTSDAAKNTVNVSAPAASAPASSGGGSKSVAVNAGYNHLGTPYVWAGKGPGGFDCSGFVSWAYGQAGYNIPSSTAGLQSTGTKVSYSDVQPGDLVFFNTYKTNGHVGIYVGNGNFIGAQNSTGLAVASMSSSYWGNAFKGHVRRIN